MQIQFESQPYSSIQADALVTYIFDKEDKIEGVLADLNSAMKDRLASLVSSGEVTGKPLSLTLIHFPEGVEAKRLLLIGAGKSDKFATADLRKIAGTAFRYLKNLGAKKIVFLAREGQRGANAVRYVAEGLVIGDFESDKYKTDK